MNKLETIVQDVEEPKKGITDRIMNYYYKPKGFEKWKSGKIYEYIGIKKFQKFILKTGRALGRKKENELYGTNYYIGESKSKLSLKKFEKKSRENEAVHMFPGIGLTALGASLAIVGIGTGILPITVGVFNIYLGCLQRYNRARIYNVIEYKDKKNGIRKTC